MNEAEYLMETYGELWRPRRELSVEIIASLKTWLKHAYLHRSIDIKFIFDSARVGFVQLRKYSPNRRRRPSSRLLAVLVTFLAIILTSSYS